MMNNILNSSKKHKMNTISNQKSIYDQLARQAILDSKPSNKEYNFINSGREPLLFITNGSRLLRLPVDVRGPLQKLQDHNERSLIDTLLLSYQKYEHEFIDPTPVQNPKTYALSLAIAQSCNLGCSYCYAAQGGFGGASKMMDVETAKQSIDFILNDKVEGEKIQISFMGGEPLMNRKGIQSTTLYAQNKAQAKGVDVNFSITTNGTLIRTEDILFFEKHGFAVTISLDGGKEEHDLQRPMKNGKGSFDIILKNIEPMLRSQSKMQVSARITVTPQNINVSETLQNFIDLGFYSVGLSPLLNANDHNNELNGEQLEHLLSEMIACGLAFEKAVLQGKPYPFLNMMNAYKEIEKNTHKPYPCGAGAGYLGVSAEGDFAACHRFVNDDKGALGSLSAGIDSLKQNKWLEERHVLNQKPCHQCWARFLCGGGCHHEIIDNGRTACEFIRSWLTFCIQSYDRVTKFTAVQ